MKNRGITLIALVITIIVLLILAGISLSLTLGENGILTKAREARIAQRDAEIEEELKMAYAGFKTAQMSKQITEKNIYKAQVDYVKTKMEERYGNKLKEVYKSGKYTKAEFKNNDTVYVLKHDGTTYHYVRMKPTEVWARLDEENETVYLRATKLDGYKKISYGIAGYFDVEKTKNVTIEEEIAPNNMTRMFYVLKKLEKINNIENLHTENFTSMDGMFESCNSLKELDLNRFDTINVTNMGRVFFSDGALNNVNLDGFDTSSVQTMALMFEGCISLEELDLSGFDTDNVDNMGRMFLGIKVKEMDLSNFNIKDGASMGAMFNWGTKIQNIKIKAKSNLISKLKENYPDTSDDVFEMVD